MTEKKVSFSEKLSVFEYEENEQELFEKRICIQRIHEKIEEREKTIFYAFWGSTVLISFILYLCKITL